MSPRPKSEDRHPDLQAGIKEAAWKQIAEAGASALSLRAVARDLHITAPSIYTYFLSRDELVTALIVDAFDSLADALAASVLGFPEDRPVDRLPALGYAYRGWAITHPQHYHLIFGTPIPHYHAPEELTAPPANRTLAPLIDTLRAIQSAGLLRVERMAALSPKLAAMLADWQAFVGEVDLEVLYLALVIWSRVHGLVMFEITGQYGPFITDPAEVFQREIDNILNQYL